MSTPQTQSGIEENDDWKIGLHFPVGCLLQLICLDSSKY